MFGTLVGFWTSLRVSANPTSRKPWFASSPRPVGALLPMVGTWVRVRIGQSPLNDGVTILREKFAAQNSDGSNSLSRLNSSSQLPPVSIAHLRQTFSITGRLRFAETRARGSNLARMLGICSYLAPFLRYGDLLATNCLFFLPLSHSSPSFPLEFWGEVNHEETRVMGLSSSEDHMIVA